MRKISLIKGDKMIRKIRARNINEIYRNSVFSIVDTAPPIKDIEEFSKAIVSSILYIREKDYDFYSCGNSKLMRCKFN